jgi:pilus assembly protein CpaC
MRAPIRRAGRVRPVDGIRKGGRAGSVARLAILLIAIVGSSIVYAAGEPENVHLVVGRSTVIDAGTPIARVSLTSADVADVLVTSQNELLVNGKAPGTISMFVWDRAGAIHRYEIIVQRDLARLSDQLKQLFPGEPISAHTSGKGVVLSGSVSSKAVIDNAVNLATGYVDRKEDVVNMLQLSESGPSNQVLLRVRFAEVSRSALTELGASFFTSPTGVKNNIARVTTEQFPSPGFADLQVTKQSGDFGAPVTSASGKFTFSDFLNFFLFNEKYDLGTMVRALQTRGLFQSLAEPNLVAESGKEASFLAGGEVPVPIAQPSGGTVAITIMYKEFGIRLNFTPTVNGDRVHLKVRPEVSTLDFTNAVVLQGFRIPALSTRRTETELELQNKQTFAIAGLINNTMNKSLQKVPGIGDIPILGLLFRSQAAQKDRTELVVMITPEILPRNSRGVTTDVPRLQEPFMPPMPPKSTLEMPPPAFTGPSSSAAAAAAAKMKALNPQSVTIMKGDAPTVTPEAAATRPLTPQEKAALARSHKEEEAAKAADAKARAKQLEELRRKGGDQSKFQRDQNAEASRTAAVAARRQAEVDKAAKEVAAKKAAEDAKRQAEIDKKNQKAVAEAEAKLKAAQAAYEAEVAKTKKQQQQ